MVFPVLYRFAERCPAQHARREMSSGAAFAAEILFPTTPKGQ
jgi:hypothetical protein